MGRCKLLTWKESEGEKVKTFIAVRLLGIARTEAEALAKCKHRDDCVEERELDDIFPPGTTIPDWVQKVHPEFTPLPLEGK